MENNLKEIQLDEYVELLDKEKIFKNEEDNKLIVQSYKDLCKNLPLDLGKIGRKKVLEATKFAIKKHRFQRRKSGEPFVTHPLKVATIVAKELNLGVNSITAAILHDTIEDTETTFQEISKYFGKIVANMVEGLTKIKESTNKFNKDNLQVENYKKLILTLPKDLRVILIKLADRLHNLRTIDSMTRNGQLRIVHETEYLYAPISHKLGLFRIKEEMEDIWLKYTHNEEYNKLKNQILETKKARRNILTKFIKPLKENLEKVGITYKIIGRTKSIYSIWKKLKNQNITMNEIFDLFAVRIIIKSNKKDEKLNCWRVYSIVTDIFKPHPERLRDWISVPKSNGYRSLHTTVMDNNGKWLEVQIRTEEMNLIAERGIAAHWKYKNANEATKNLELIVKKIIETFSNENSYKKTSEMLEDLKNDIFSDEIFIFSKDSKIIKLPKHSTLLDFAYNIHTDIGNSCKGGIIDGQMVSLDYILKNGDKVNVITHKSQVPNYDWLDYVKTTKAKNAIKNYFKNEEKKNLIKGEEMVTNSFAKDQIELNEDLYKQILNKYKFYTKNDLYKAVYSGIIDLEEIKYEILKKKGFRNRLGLALYNRFNFSKSKKTEPKIKLKKTYKKEIENYELSTCCLPVLGDEIFGIFDETRNIIEIHSPLCHKTSNIFSMEIYHLEEINWSNLLNLPEKYLTKIKISGNDKIGFIKEIILGITDKYKLNIKSFYINSRAGLFIGNIYFYISDVLQLNKIIDLIHKIDGVNKIERS